LKVSTDYIKRLVGIVVKDHQLDLRGLTVLTECASGPFQITPLLALAGGAEKVIALGSNSQYGKFNTNKRKVLTLSKDLGLKEDLEFINSYEECDPGEVDIVTNLAMLRPISKEFIQEMKSTSAIALMFEPWEYRRTDFDIDVAIKNEVSVVGTNESNSLVATLQYVGLLALKLLLENDIAIFGSSIWIIGDDIFGTKCQSTLEKLGAMVELTITHKNSGNISPKQIPDAVIVVENKNPNILVFNSQTSSGQEWTNKGVKIIHICGNLDVRKVRSFGLDLIPESPANFGFMSFNTSYLGYEPVARLHSGGLKAAETVVRARMAGKTLVQSISDSELSGFGLGFH